MSATAHAQVSFQYRVINDWGSGYTAEIVVQNNGTAAIQGWTLGFDLAGTMVNLWNGQWSQSGNRFTVRDAGWNSQINASGSVLVGFQVSYTGGVRPDPTACTFNGANCTFNGTQPALPTVRLTAPVSGATVSGTVVLTATTTGEGAQGVTFFANNTAIGPEDTSAPYEVQWNTTMVSDGIYALKANSRTTNGTVSASEINVTVRNQVTDPPPVTAGFLSVSGKDIIDANNQIVRLTGINWFGFETSNSAPHGLWSRDYRSMLKQIKSLGFNTLRLPWGNHILKADASASGITFSGADAYDGTSPMNAPLQGKSPLQILDLIIEEAGRQGLRVILDNHSRKADNFMNEDLWYLSDFSEAQWIADWVALANRYRNNTTVVGFDLDNEPHGSATWGNSNPATDWNKAAERAAAAILAVHPDLLMIVEGVQNHNGSYWWGGNLEGAKNFPLNINAAKLVYSPHDYGPEVYAQTWFNEATFPQNMTAIWDQRWGFLFKENRAPILLGEFGIKEENAYGGKALQWIKAVLAYMGGTQSWTYWTWNPNSGDTGGILKDDWVSVHNWKMDLLRPYLAAPITATPLQGPPKPPTANEMLLFPNPAQTQTRIRFTANASENIQVVLYNLLGQEVKILFSGFMTAQQVIELPVSVQKLAAGPYWIRVQNNNQTIYTKRLTVTR
ncbi:MAG TPA: cellulase family glycosylhydrolase [Rhodothermales bacterium]|nr:cellulase family glycosylhydrolase [Rhodothermales bacterium]